VGPRAPFRAAVGALVLAVLVAAPASAVSRAPADGSNPLLGRHYAFRPAAAVRAEAAPAARNGATLVACDEAGPDGQCGTVDVPLDRADPSRGTVPIFFLYFRHRGPAPANEAIVVTGGGPGFSITSIQGIVDYHRQVFDSLLETRDLIFLDQRGVGGSDAIDCPQIQHGSDDPFRDIAACGTRLGSTASRYSTADVAQDIDAVRAALGIDKLDFYGGSYAGVDVQAYATRFPQHLRSAVLDSPVVLGPYDFDAPTVRAVNRTVRLICARSPTCRADHDNALDDVAWLARRLREQPLAGAGFDAVGERHEVRLTEGLLLWRILTSDAGVYAAVSEIAAAADALRRGDPVPLLRLAAEGDGSILADEGEPREFSAGHNNARFCTDAPMPWDKGAAGPERVRQWRVARDALDENAFAPYSVDAWLSPAPIGPLGPDLCVAWPPPGRDIQPPVPSGAAFPGSVPALVLSGDLDSNTPSSKARRLARAWPNSSFLELSNSGHQTLVDGRAQCAAVLVAHFIATLQAGEAGCASDPRFRVPAVGRFPLAAAGARAAERARGDHSTTADRKVATVAAAAVTDTFRRSVLAQGPGSGVGLRGGTFSQDLNAEQNGILARLTGVRFAGDVAVSGEATYVFEDEAIDGTVAVDGPGAEDGTLHVSGVWFATAHEATRLQITGTLGGRAVALRVPAV
jgi:pimeloyl-ACP methyl ester carboxylesterase